MERLASSHSSQLQNVHVRDPQTSCTRRTVKDFALSFSSAAGFAMVLLRTSCRNRQFGQRRKKNKHEVAKLYAETIDFLPGSIMHCSITVGMIALCCCKTDAATVVSGSEPAKNVRIRSACADELQDRGGSCCTVFNAVLNKDHAHKCKNGAQVVMLWII
jgi:hypothetical protein